jgi:hypothetical protein
VVAALLLFSASFVVGLLPVVVVVAATMLWSREARDWFDGRAPRPAGAAAGAGSGAASRTPLTGPPAPGPRLQGPPSPPGNPWAPGAASTTPVPAPWPGPGATVAPYSLRRPTTVTVAAWLTWAFAGSMALFFGLVVLVMLAARDQLLEAIQRDPTIGARGWSTTQILSTLWVLSAVAIVWSLAAMALAALAFRRVNAGRIGLAISATASGAVCLVPIGVGWPHAIAAFATVALLFLGGANRWYGRVPPPNQTWPDRTPPNRPEQPPRDRKPPVW